MDMQWTESKRLKLVDVGPHDCRFAVNDAKPGEDHLFCGLRAEPGKPYCQAHCRVVYSRHEAFDER